MAKYDINTFISRIDNMSKEIEKKEKKKAIGLVIHSLQRPQTEILQAVCEKQKKDVEELYKSLGW